MKFIPLFDQVVIEMNIAPEKIGNIYLPEQARKAPDQGVIISIGKDVTAVEVGQKVIFGKYIGVQLKLKDKDGLLIIHEADIIGILEEEDEDIQ